MSVRASNRGNAMVRTGGIPARSHRDDGLARGGTLFAVVVVLLVGMLALAGCTSAGQSSKGSERGSGNAVTASGSPEQTASTEASDGPSGTSAGGKSPTTTSSSLSPLPTTPVPPPSTGNIHQTVKPQTVQTKSSVALTAKAVVGRKVSVKLTKIRPITTTASLPGEVAGPGLAVTIVVDNGSSRAIDLSNVVVDLRGSTGSPAIPMSASPAVPFAGELSAGASATGVYVFSIPTNQRKPISVRFSYTTEEPTVLFAGDAQ